MNFNVTITVSEKIGEWTRSRTLPNFVIEADNEVKAIELADNIVNPFQDYKLGTNRNYEISVSVVNDVNREWLPDWEIDLASSNMPEPERIEYLAKNCKAIYDLIQADKRIAAIKYLRSEFNPIGDEFVQIVKYSLVKAKIAIDRVYPQ